MSSTSNAQNLLVNVFRPTYTYQAGVGYTPSLVVSNVDKIVTDTVVTSSLIINDPASNIYIGSNAGNSASNVRASSNNVAIGYNAGNGFSNTSNTVALGYNALGGSLSNVSNTVALGANTIGGGVNNILIGHDTGTVGSNNILLGPNQTPGNVSNQLRIGSNSNTVIAADLSNRYVGINNTDPVVSFDVSGQAYFRNKVGVQVEAPTKSLEVNGETYSSIGFLAGRGSTGKPAFAFYADPSAGMYSPGNGYGSLVANGSPYITFGAGTINFHNRTFVNADISGGGGGTAGYISLTNGYIRDTSGGTFLTDISEGNVYTVGDTFTNNLIYSGFISNTNTNTSNVIGGVVLSNGDVSANTYNGPGGTANAPHYTFSDDRTTGFFFPGANMIGFTAGGTERVRISNANVGIGTTAPGTALDVSGVIRVIGSAGNITFSNGTINAAVGINISGSSIVASNGAFSNASTTSNSIGGVTLSNTNLTLAGTITGSTANTSNVIGGVVLSNNNVSNSGVITTGTGSNSVGGVTLSNTNLTLAGTITGSTANTSNVIGGVVLSNNNISNSGVITAGTGSNFIGGVILSNTDISQGGSHTAGRVLVGTGSASVPSLAFSAVPTLGMYGINNNEFAFASSNAERLRINQYGIYNDSNASNVLGGVILTSNTLRPPAGTASAPAHAFSNDTATGLFSPGTSQLGFATAGAQQMVISNSNVGIGTASPFANLDVSAAGATIRISDLRSNGIPSLEFMRGSNPTFGGDVNTDWRIRNIVGGNLTFLRADNSGIAGQNGELVTMTYDGKVGIRTTGPSYALDVSGGGIMSRGGGLYLFSRPSYGALHIYGHPTQNLAFFEDASSGSTAETPPTTNPYGWQLGVSSPATDSSTSFMLVRNNGAQTRYPPAFVVNSNYNVGLGKAAPAYALDVCAGPGLASVNMSTWARFPVSNTLIAVAENTQVGGFNGGSYNFSNPIQSMNTELLTFTNSNASVGGSWVIKKSGIWSINITFVSAAAQYVFVDVSTGNVASNSFGSNGASVISFGGQNQGAVGNLSYVGFLPSNSSYLYKVRGGSNLSNIGTFSNRMTITFLGETDNVGGTFPF